MGTATPRRWVLGLALGGGGLLLLAGCAALGGSGDQPSVTDHCKAYFSGQPAGTNVMGYC